MRETILEALSPLKASVLILEDQSQHHVGHGASGGHFKLTIACPQFEGLSKVACHRLIYQALGTLMQGPIHALQIEIV